MPKLSIITINLNNAKGLRQTINSIIEQDFKNYEYIIVDGASTDDSVNVIKEFSKYITNWISEKDDGIYNAMNKGIVKAKGEYLLFINSGDQLFNNSVLKKIFSVQSTADIIYGDANYMYPDGTVKTFKSLSEEELTLANFNTNNRATISHPAAFIKRSLFDNNLYDETYKIIADIKFFIEQIIFKNCTVHYIPTVISNFMLDGLSSNPKNWAATINERERIFIELLPPRILKDYEFVYLAKDSLLLKYLPTLNKTTGFQRITATVVGFMIKIYQFTRKII